ncbi:DNA-binding protein [Streptomyces sp. NPDC001750]|uniref:DNA-binding protein n=1 Tax=Streptomyces sp. NPDC001750 TaxID=3364607 RepID=UPI0036A7EF3E
MSELLNADALTTADLLKLPPTVDVATAGRAMGICRDTAYMLVRSDAFPCKVIKAGARRYRVVTADLLRVLQVQAPADHSAGPAAP